MKNKLIKLLGGYTEIEIAEIYLEGYVKGCEKTENLMKKYATSPGSKWFNSQQKKLKNNGVSVEPSTTTTFQGISRVAYTSKLGAEIPAYSLRTDKSTSNTAINDNKDVGQNKKKIRPLKQSRKRPGFTR